jgi:hypothetical protein
LKPPHTLALSFQCKPAFSQPARVKGWGVVSTADAGTIIASEAHTIINAGTLFRQISSGVGIGLVKETLSEIDALGCDARTFPKKQGPDEGRG